jgi:hypothetical protein
MRDRILQRPAGKPWTVDVCIEFKKEQLALRFEKHLKSGSGHAFRARHFT